MDRRREELMEDAATSDMACSTFATVDEWGACNESEQKKKKKKPECRLMVQIQLRKKQNESQLAWFSIWKFLQTQKAIIGMIWTRLIIRTCFPHRQHTFGNNQGSLECKNWCQKYQTYTAEETFQ